MKEGIKEMDVMQQRMRDMENQLTMMFNNQNQQADDENASFKDNLLIYRY